MDLSTQDRTPMFNMLETFSSTYIVTKPVDLQKGLEAIVEQDKNARFEMNVLYSFCQHVLCPKEILLTRAAEDDASGRSRKRLPYHASIMDCFLQMYLNGSKSFGGQEGFMSTAGMRTGSHSEEKKITRSFRSL